jgi:spore germination cell wall hydrolase CwlJ-like protein
LIARSEFEVDPFEPSFEEKIFLVAKRGCIGFAGVALALGLLDIANIHSSDAAFKFWQNSRVNILALGGTIRTGVQSISIVPASLSSSSPESISVRIPTNKPRAEAKPQSPVAELAAARTQDAVQMAMAPPPVLAKREQAKRELPLSALTALAAAPLRENLIEPMIPKPVPARLTVTEPEIPILPAPVIAPPPMGSLPSATDSPISLALVPLPRPAPGAPLPSPAERLGLKGKEYTRAERCLANAVYFEARSEPVRGQMAVAQVVMNRVFSGFYPNDVCGVVYQNAQRHLACQFTFACDGKRKVINERGNWARANRIAHQTLEGQIYLPEVAKSTHYHASYVHPNWVHEMKRLVRYGLHSFYRPYAWGNGAEEPVWGRAAMAEASVKQASIKKTASK